ncbi:hypothetical protein [Nitrosopumilus maritimus]|uniref:Uncharacterized protein n=1 Tax=Nitrosopumilus maritimus (strain SCM1) TaxID=436308 RepID=A9A3U4_NITMS|nr:hypothetical protein [Nitrosopumilus maritimus]ABX13356.1 hypothetical protein Nmar_1460 [Nitrosopumilus maritimus SCM1]
MKTRFLIIIGVIMMTTIPFVTFAALDRYENYLEQLEYERQRIENEPKPGERSYIEPELKAKLEGIELDLRKKVRQLHEDLPPSSYAVNLNHQTKEIEAVIENKELIPIIKEFTKKYPDDVAIIVEYGKISIDGFNFRPNDDVDVKSKEYIANCDETIHKEKLPDLIIENSTHNYDMQYCKWELKYPDLTLISDKNLLNNYPYCAELFDTLFEYYQSIRDPCGMQRYNEDGTPRGICEPAPAGAGVPYDLNMIKSGCAFSFEEWAYQTNHNDDVFYLFDRAEINTKIHDNLDEYVPVIDKLCNDNDYLNVKPNIKFRNNTHWIDTDHCTLNRK